MTFVGCLRRQRKAGARVRKSSFYRRNRLRQAWTLMRIRPFRTLLSVLLLLCATTPAHAIITGGLDFSDPYIGVAGGAYNEEILIDATGTFNPLDPSQTAFIQIEGGFNSNCTGPPQTSNLVTIDTGGRDGASVVTVRGNASVYLLRLALAGAVVTNHGGGIDFDGGGLLDLAQVDIYGNHGGYGSGVFANGQSALDVVLHAETVIEGNVASHSGGGIYISGQTHLTALEPQTLIFNNTANAQDSNGTGGGVEVNGSQAVADIASAGYVFPDGTDDPVLFYNHARRGGAIGVENHGIVRLFSVTAGRPTRVGVNDAV